MDLKEKKNNIEYEMKKDFMEKVENVFQESTINLIINNKEIKYGKIEYSLGFINYEEFIKPFPSNPEIKFDNEKDKNYKKLISYLNKIKELINKNIPKSEFDLVIKINLKRDFQDFNDNNKIINSEYSLEKGLFIEVKNCQDKNILNEDNYEGFITFLNEITKYHQLSSTKSRVISNDTSTSKYSNYSIENIKEFNKYHFIYFIKVIGKHKNIAEKIRELKDGSFISDGYNEMIEYDMDLEIKNCPIKLKNYYTFFIDKDDNVIISQKNKFNFPNKRNIRKDIDTKFSCRNLFNLRNNRYILCDENGLYYCIDSFENPNSIFKINKLSFRGGIEIDEIVGITSNRILSKGKNKLIFFSSVIKLILKEIEVKNYSFTLSVNNCALMRIPNKNNDKLLLFACKKYRKGDKNGILLLKLQLYIDSKKKFEKFYDTKNYEVYCFCPILEIKNEYSLKKSDKSQANETGYFFVGGFDINKNEGVIKLYKVIYDNEIEKIEIEYIQDIIVGKKKEDPNSFKGFKGPISCIIQSSTGEILITCYDGNVYLFSEPRLDILKQDYNIFK